MHTFILENEVHAGCGGRVRERVYPELVTARKDRIKRLYANGHIDERGMERMLREVDAEATKDRQLECILCGDETAEYGSADKPQRSQLQLQRITANVV
ncbi:MAG: hypothetical protein LC754_06095 [Acidobacteria bacterium]|nr:hypothetical protein [Acidobacteriota bacterium]